LASILIVEDDPDISDLIAHYLQRAGHEVTRLTSGSEVMPRVRTAPPDLVILDLMLPGMDGLLVCQAMRANTATAAIPIIMLTARGDEADRIAGLELGADDYVTKPFSAKELVARVAARLRRHGTATATAAGIVRYQNIAIDADRHIVTLDGVEVKLTAKEFLLLQYLVNTAVACCRATCSSPTSGGISTLAAHGPSTCTFDGCAKNCQCSTMPSKRSSSLGTSCCK